jgi:K319-like protein
LSFFDRGTDAKVEGARTRASSGSRRTAHFRRLVTGSRRRTIAFLALTLLLGTAAVAIAGPSGSIVDGAGTQRANEITKFGPINPDNGFPDWYRDSRGNEVEPCLQAADPMCNAPEVPDPDQATTFPDNFPGEFFYWLGEASMTANGDNAFLAEFAVEGTFAAEVPRFPDQMVFTRTRYRVRGGVLPDSDYTITSPYGVDVVHTDADQTEFFVTEDVGATAGAFGQLFAGQVGPFLKWDADKPAGYLGDPTVPHTVTGSRLGTNYVKVEGPGIGGTNNPNPCPGLDAATSPDCIYTDLFSIMGKESTRGGVDVARATYSRATNGASQLDVLAESKADKDIVVRDTALGTARRFSSTPLAGEEGRYFAHVNTTSVPDRVEVLNRSDIPQTVKSVGVTDLVTGAAKYDADAHKLTVTAESSDKNAPGGFTAVGFGAMPDKTTTTTTTADDGTETTTTTTTNGVGTGEFNGVGVPPNSVKITSGHGGSVEVPVEIAGANGTAPVALAALISAPASVEQRSTITLDGTASTGDVDSYKWTSAEGIAITNDAAPKATFQSGGRERDLHFTLTVTSATGTPSTASQTVTIHVKPVTTPVPQIVFNGQILADGATVNVPQNLELTLDASGTAGANAFTWTRVAGPGLPAGTVRNTSTLTFVMPKSNPNPATDDITLQLEARRPGVSAAECATVVDGCKTMTITLHPEVDTLATTKARFVTNGSRWVVDGTASSITRNRVHVYSGRTTDATRLIGSSDVLADHTWSVDARDSTIPLTDCKCVTLVSDRGGQLEVALEKPEDLPATGVPPAPAAAAALARPAASVPLAGAALLAVAPATLVPSTVSVASVAARGVPVTVSVPTGASLVRLRVLTTANKALFSTFKKVKGGTKVKVNLRSAKLRKQLRKGRRYVIEVRAGTAKNRLGKPTRKVIRVR